MVALESLIRDRLSHQSKEEISILLALVSFGQLICSMSEDTVKAKHSDLR